MNEKLTYKELEELLPDYAFNRLDESTKIQFENSINDYSDLVDELEQIKSVFSKVEDIDINKSFEDQTRNISVKVIDKLSRTQTRSNFIPKVVFPTLGVLFIAYLSFFSNVFDHNQTKKVEKELFTFNELENFESEEMIYFLKTDYLLDQSAELQIFSDIEVDGNIEYIVDEVSIEALTKTLTEEEFDSLIEEIYEIEIGA